MTKKKEKTTLEILQEQCVCGFCGKKKCNDEHEWDSKMLHLRCEGYNLEELDYKVRKLYDAYEEVKKTVDEQIEENQMCKDGWEKQKPKPVKKAG